jgi:hypothetical protein
LAVLGITVFVGGVLWLVFREELPSP